MRTAREYKTTDKDQSELTIKRSYGFGHDTMTLGVQQDGDWCGILLNKQQALDLAAFLKMFAHEMIHEGQEECKIPPAGWWCSRHAGHDGPCAAWKTESD